MYNFWIIDSFRYLYCVSFPNRSELMAFTDWMAADEDIMTCSINSTNFEWKQIVRNWSNSDLKNESWMSLTLEKFETKWKQKTIEVSIGNVHIHFRLLFWIIGLKKTLHIAHCFHSIICNSQILFLL